MPGAIPHFVAGCVMFILGKYYFKSYFEGEDKVRETYLLLLVCITFSFVPDFLLIIYYAKGIFPSHRIFFFHTFVHFIMVPIAIIYLIALKDRIDKKRVPIWIMGMLCIILHVILDLLIPDYGIWI
ncbi:MAG: hypothetical protein JSV09_03670 [Thermoplasmata archaeon]|nr:MAG: hypothetical protein JSV09_03670 [Thermoplasmata archaeon]